jgi:hypothetical protein
MDKLGSRMEKIRIRIRDPEKNIPDPQHWLHLALIRTAGAFLHYARRNWSALSCLYDLLISVADPGCLSRIPDPTFFHPGSERSPSRIRIKEF